MGKNLLLGLLTIVILFFLFSNPQHVGDKVIIKTDTLIEHKTDVKYKKGKDIFHKIIELDTIYKIDEVHDTAFIVKDYNTVVAYSDSIKVDSSSFVINDTISKNKIIGRSFQSRIAQKTIIIDRTIVKSNNNEVYLGLLGDLRRFDNKIGVGAGILYRKPKEAYIINFTTNQISLGLYKKLF